MDSTEPLGTVHRDSFFNSARITTKQQMVLTGAVGAVNTGYMKPMLGLHTATPQNPKPLTPDVLALHERG